ASTAAHAFALAAPGEGAVVAETVAGAHGPPPPATPPRPRPPGTYFPPPAPLRPPLGGPGPALRRAPPPAAAPGGGGRSGRATGEGWSSGVARRSARSWASPRPASRCRRRARSSTPSSPPASSSIRSPSRALLRRRRRLRAAHPARPSAARAHLLEHRQLLLLLRVEHVDEPLVEAVGLGLHLLARRVERDRALAHRRGIGVRRLERVAKLIVQRALLFPERPHRLAPLLAQDVPGRLLLGRHVENAVERRAVAAGPGRSA